jgi:hypothetical protein
MFLSVALNDNGLALMNSCSVKRLVVNRHCPIFLPDFWFSKPNRSPSISQAASGRRCRRGVGSTERHRWLPSGQRHEIDRHFDWIPWISNPSGFNVIPRRARPGLAGLTPHNPSITGYEWGRMQGRSGPTSNAAPISTRGATLRDTTPRVESLRSSFLESYLWGCNSM